MKDGLSYFVTGGAGCIGSTMVDALMKRGAVTVYDNLCSGKVDFIEHHRGDGSFRFVEGDVGDLERLTEGMEGHDVVFHFAANPDIARAMEDPSLDLREGTLLTSNVLEAMRRNGVGTILYSSGSGIYGDVGERETGEDFGPLLPISMYGASKLACEGLISAYCHMFDMASCIFRFANVVGLRQTHGVAYDFINRLRENPATLSILGDGTQSKAYIHVSDVVDAMLYVHDHCDDRVNYFNVATDDYITVTEIAGLVIEEMELDGVALEYAGGSRGWKGDVPVVRFDVSKIKAAGWSSSMGSKEAMVLSIREMLGSA